MSSQTNMPYHLRQNKAIDRSIFVDCLQRVGRIFNISSYQYVGFGGLFLEDFKAIHSGCRITKMISLEKYQNIYNRQAFNKPLRTIKLNLKTSGEFIDENEFNKQTVIWLDYVTPSELYDQLNEISSLVKKLNHADIVKITVNANPESLGGRQGTTLHNERFESFKDRVGDYQPSIMTAQDVTAANYPALLAKTVNIAIDRGMRLNLGKKAIPLSVYTYRDGQKMLTITFAIIDLGKEIDFIKTTRFSHWRYYSNGWDIKFDICVPNLSLKERMCIESEGPFVKGSAERIHKKMKFYFGSDINESKSAIESFAQFYRINPQYTKVVI